MVLISNSKLSTFLAYLSSKLIHRIPIMIYADSIEDINKLTKYLEVALDLIITQNKKVTIIVESDPKVKNEYY